MAEDAEESIGSSETREMLRSQTGAAEGARGDIREYVETGETCSQTGAALEDLDARGRFGLQDMIGNTYQRIGDLET